jgi:hypothetical protein
MVCDYDAWFAWGRIVSMWVKGVIDGAATFGHT